MRALVQKFIIFVVYQVKCLYNRNFKSFKKETEEDNRKIGKIFHAHG